MLSENQKWNLRNHLRSTHFLLCFFIFFLFFVLRPVATPYLPRRSHVFECMCVCVHDVKCIDWCERNLHSSVRWRTATEFRYQVYSFFPSQDGNTLAAPNLHSSFITEVVKHNLINICCTESWWARTKYLPIAVPRTLKYFVSFFSRPSSLFSLCAQTLKLTISFF